MNWGLRVLETYLVLALGSSIFVTKKKNRKSCFEEYHYLKSLRSCSSKSLVFHLYLAIRTMFFMEFWCVCGHARLSSFDDPSPKRDLHVESISRATPLHNHLRTHQPPWYSQARNENRHLTMNEEDQRQNSVTPPTKLPNKCSLDPTPKIKYTHEYFCFSWKNLMLSPLLCCCCCCCNEHLTKTRRRAREEPNSPQPWQCPLETERARAF